MYQTERNDYDYSPNYLKTKSQVFKWSNLHRYFFDGNISTAMKFAWKSYNPNAKNNEINPVVL